MKHSPISPSRAGFSRSERGFSLVEILVVMTIMALLGVMAVPAVNSLGTARQVDTGARLVSNLMTIARSEAISLRTPVQLRIVTDQYKIGGTDDPKSHYRKVSLWKFVADDPANPGNPTWQCFSKWETLPESVVFEILPNPTTDTKYYFPTADKPAATDYFLSPDYLTQNLTQSTAALTNQSTGAITANMTAIEFSPTGAVNLGTKNNAMLYVLLTEGYTSGSSLVYTRMDHPNWAMVRLTPLTGRVSVLRPQ